jgi:hypothetical protein
MHYFLFNFLVNHMNMCWLVISLLCLFMHIIAAYIFLVQLRIFYSYKVQMGRLLIFDIVFVVLFFVLSSCCSCFFIYFLIFIFFKCATISSRM